MDAKLEELIRSKYGSLTEVEADQVGMAHEVYFLKFKSGREMVLKVSDEGLNHRFSREPFVLNELREHNLPVPEVVDFRVEESGNLPPFLLMTRVKGQNIHSYSEGRKFKYLPSETKEAIVKDAAAKLASIHSKASYDDFGAFESGMDKRYRSNDWSETLLQILEKNELGGIEDGEFSDLFPEAKTFLKENISLLNTGSRPVMVHQDYSFKNMIVQGDNISAIIDWERAVSGHREFDLFKFERSIRSKFKTGEIGEKYGRLLVEEYCSIHSLKGNWKERRNIYFLISLIESMWTFEEWSENFSEEVSKQIKSNMVTEFKSRIRKEETRIFQHMN